MKLSRLLTILIFLYGNNLLAQGIVPRVYVNVPEENLRAAPNGRKIGTLTKGTETVVLSENDKWVKVQITGWIWKESMTTIRPSTGKGEYRALHILVETREQAEEILAQLKAGKDFIQLAKEKSKSPSSVKGGDLGYFNKGDFDPKIESVIAGLQMNEISSIFETSYGFNIFKRIE
ncbi:peptidylprolyl isomerase [candidate division KSB1 bacterium]|nr:peptidylprolyl isomerase [candidate division KSB1 bacterium]